MKKVARNMLALALLVFALSAGLSPPAEGAVSYVTPSGGGAQDGTSWKNAFGEAQFPAAIQSADVGDELWIAMGSYRPSSADVNVSFDMKSGVALYGGFAGTETSRDQRNWATNETILTGALGGGLHSRTVVTGSGTDGTALLDGFTITGGKNGSGGNGGGMYNDGGSPTVTNCTFSDNEASDRGGAMYNDDNSSPTVTNCTFSDNEAGDQGGAIYSYDGSSPTVTNCTFTGNEAQEGGAICNFKNSSPTVTNSAFSANKARSRGGAINNFNSSPTVTNCTFSGNEAGAGGAINNGSSNPTVTNCAFSDNEVTHYGGAMHNDNSSPTVTDCIFSGNEATDFDGGAIYNDNSSPTVTNCTFSGNAAGKDGGAMYNDSSNPTVADCTFSDNEADEGGAMYNDGSSPTVTDCTFSGNKGTHYYGGAIYNDNSSPTVTDCTFSNNEASFNGGAMHNDSSNPTVANCTFSDNEANYGGAISNWNNSSPTVTNCTLSDNVAGKDGGAMHNRNVSEPTVTNCTFSGNEADEGGAMYNTTGSSPTVTNCTFSDNEASEGGAMYNFGSSPTIVNSILWGSSGGEIVNSGSTTSPDVTYCVISGGYGGTTTSYIISGDPLLLPLDEYGGATKTFALRGGSSAIDRGTSAHVSADIPSADQRGFPRDVSRDIGSYERRDDLKILTVTVTGLGTVGRDPSGDALTSSNQWIYSRDLPVTLTATPISPDHFEGWGGALSGTASSTQLTMTEDRYVTANFGDSWTLLATAGRGGTITPSGQVRVRRGTDLTFAIDASSGYSLSEVTVDGASVGIPSSYTFRNVTANHSISAVFSENEDWIIAAQAGEGGTISPSGAVRVPHGGSATFAISAKAPFTTEDVVVDGASQGPLSSYTFSNVRANHDIKALFTAVWTIDASANEGGTISPSGAVRVPHRGNVTFAISPEEGQIIAGVAVDGAPVGVGETYTFTDVRSDHTIEASFSGDATGGDSGGGCQMAGTPLSYLWLFLPLTLLRRGNR